MKIAILTDIHGNASALKAALADIDDRGDIQEIYCLGDMIAIGPETNEVLDILFQRDNLFMITGNHDEAVLALNKDEEYPLSHRDVYIHHAWIEKRMNQKFVEPLSKLPRQIYKEFLGHRVLFTHYQIPDERLQSHISQDPFSSIVEPTLDQIETLFSGVDADLICFGHHHPVHFFKGKKKTYLNPGSLGCSTTQSAKFAIVSFSEKDFAIDLQEISYDNRDFLLSYEQLAVPSREFIVKVFHGGQLRNN